MLRASYKLENLQIMLPMISNVGEVEAAIRLIKRGHHELLQEGLSMKFPPILSSGDPLEAEKQAKTYQQHRF